jgi:hypothetical protein
MRRAAALMVVGLATSQAFMLPFVPGQRGSMARPADQAAVQAAQPGFWSRRSQLSMSSSTAEAPSKPKGETFEFQAEVSRCVEPAVPRHHSGLCIPPCFT